jgi:hypothetical protein
MQLYFRWLIVLLLLVYASVAAADGVPIPRAGESGKATPIVVNAQTADRFLRPGDLLLLLYGGKQANLLYKLAEVAIVGAQKLAKKTAGLFSKVWRKADPEVMHGAIYLGKGIMAEADEPGIVQNSIEESKTYRLYVYRAKDASLARRAAEIADRWSKSRRMKYLPPFKTLGKADFGPHARREALQFGRAADLEGGPPEFKKMFCSQFMMAVYQSAIVSAQLVRHPDLKAEKIEMPYAMRLHASNLGPAHLDGTLRMAVEEHRDRGWEYAGVILIQP